MTSEGQRLWDTCAALLRAQVTDIVWHSVFDGVRAVDYDEKILTLGVPSVVSKERIEGRYLGLVRDALTEAGAPEPELRLQIDAVEPPSPWWVEQPQTIAPAAAVAGSGDAIVTPDRKSVV